jgi:hypothetical protein
VVEIARERTSPEGAKESIAAARLILMTLSGATAFGRGYILSPLTRLF